MPKTRRLRPQLQAAAFQEVLGIETLPHTSKEARDVARKLGDLVLAGVGVPQPSHLVDDHLARSPHTRPRFVDVSTGLRLRFLEWGTGSEVVLLLHDIGEAADIWEPIGRCLGQRGFHTFALDLRGHGESGRSLDGRYGADMLAEDVRAFILAKDLYVAPVALVGCGMGAATALALAQQNPYLAGAVLCAEFALPVAQLQALHVDGDSSSNPSSISSSQASESGGQAVLLPAVAPAQASSGNATEAACSMQLLPWWGMRAGQASTFASVEHCAACLSHPMANLPPHLFVPLAQAVQHALAAANVEAHEGSQASSSSSSSGSPAAEAAQRVGATIQELLAQTQRPVHGAVASACSLLRLPPSLRQGGQWDGFTPDGARAGLQPRMDPSFLFKFDPLAMLTGLRNLRGHLLMLHGGAGGSWVLPADAEAMSELAAAGGAASAAAREVPDAGHLLAADHPDVLLKHIVSFLDGPAIRCFDRRSLMPPASSEVAVAPPGAVPSNKSAGRSRDEDEKAVAASRRPEVLGLRSLPQYASLEEAQKALGPRSIPTAAAVEGELRKLRLEEGRGADGGSSDEEEAGTGRYRTALAKEPADYFGFVG
ncbi:2-(acetamidomethylene)succinate hydrolase [Chlorella vulgaris]